MLSVFDEHVRPEIRRTTEEVSCRLVTICDELWLMSSITSRGMELEIQAARRANIPVVEWSAVLGRIPALGEVPEV